MVNSQFWTEILKNYEGIGQLRYKNGIAIIRKLEISTLEWCIVFYDAVNSLVAIYAIAR